MLSHRGGGHGPLSSSVEVEFGANGDEVEVGGGGGRERCVVLCAEREHISARSRGDRMRRANTEGCTDCSGVNKRASCGTEGELWFGKGERAAQLTSLYPTNAILG